MRSAALLASAASLKRHARDSAAAAGVHEAWLVLLAPGALLVLLVAWAIWHSDMAKVARGLMRRRWSVIAFWCLAGLLSAKCCLDIFRVTDSTLYPPPGSAAQLAQDRYSAQFPSTVRFIVFLEAEPPAQVTELPGFANFSFALRDRLNASGQIVDFTSAETLRLEGIPKLPGITSKNGTATMLVWTIKGSELDRRSGDFALRANRVYAELRKRWLPEVRHRGILSTPTLMLDEWRECELDMLKVDIVALPMAVLVLAYVLGSGRLLLLPLFVFAVAFSVSFGSAWVLAHVIRVPSMVPPLMMSLCVAMSFDYQLFLLSRFKEELSAQPPGEDEERVMAAGVAMAQTAGFTVLSSGVTLLAAFALLGLLPTLYPFGMGCALCMMIMILAHLSLTPALLATFPSFFSKAVDRDPAAQGRGVWPFWAWLARVTTTSPGRWIVLVLCVGTVIVPSLAVGRLEMVSNMEFNLPRGSEVAEIFHRMEAAFGKGAMTPYQLLIEPVGGGNVLARGFWLTSQKVLEALAAVPGSQPDDFVSASVIRGQRVPWLALGCRHAPGLTPLCPMVLHQLQTFVNPTGTAMSGLVMRRPGTRSEHDAWLANVRQQAAELEAAVGARVSITSLNVMLSAIQEQMEVIFPKVVAGILATVLLSTGVFFRTVLTPLRCVLGIAFTLLFVYGLSVMAYQDGALDWLGVPGLRGTSGQYFLLPTLCLPVVVGLGLDYDIFLFARTCECREQGLGSVEAVREGLASSASIITGAGLIMAISFGGLLLSNIRALNALGFYMATAVLYDTFVVRCLLAPAVMSLLGRFNWWPSSSRFRGQAQKEPLTAKSVVEEAMEAPKRMPPQGSHASV